MPLAQNLRIADLEFEDFSESGAFFLRAKKAMQQAREQGVASAFAASGFWVDRPDLSPVITLGTTRWDERGGLVQPQTLFDIASVSKVFATWSLFAKLRDRGWVDFETPLRRVFNDLPFDSAGEIRMRHLLSHTAGFVWWKPFYETLSKVQPHAKRALLFELLKTSPPDARPGERMVYSDLSFLWLGLALEEISGMSLQEAVGSTVFNDLGLSQSGYRTVAFPAQNFQDLSIVATEVSEWRGGLLQGQVHDDNCWSIGGVAGHAGVFSNVLELTVFMRSLLKKNWIARETLAQSFSPIKQGELTRTPGWDFRSGPDPASGNTFSEQTLGHNGFTGTSLWIDLNRGFGVVLLTNRVHPTRENPKIKEFRPRFHDAFTEDFADWVKG